MCQKIGVPAHLIDDLSEVKPEWLEGVEYSGGDGRRFGSGESGGGADRSRCKAQGYAELEEMEIKEEDVRFNLPRS